MFLVCVLPYGGGGDCTPPPRRVGHCRGLWVSAKGAGQGVLPVVRHFANGRWGWGWGCVCPTAPPPPSVGVGHLCFGGFARNLGGVGPSNPPPPSRTVH